jgi:hypothetical protein
MRSIPNGVAREDGLQILGISEERIQGWKCRGVFNREYLFKQKVDFTKAKVIIKQ